ncbi:uncharacterized protein LOC125234006 [Leguminivora glycinivorella]|uniref:uncharacterized protein LOC125234006 n=1 Tax=Leguminivora glycinivorella TaxID=1035111 RepID=UPI00200F5AD6|nr:uncharacterized protein LOC125234006 [Leguminivora glycinivorella]
MEYYAKFQAVLFILGVVSCELCSETDIEKLFTSDNVRCQGEFNNTFSVTTAIIDDQNGILSALTPDANPSCIASNTVSLASGGIVKVTVFSESVAFEDFLTVLVYEAEEYNVVGLATLPHSNNKVNNGWGILEISLEGNPHYDGYIMLVGKASSQSKILVESICYYPAEQNKLLQEDSTLASHNEVLQTAISDQVNIKSVTERSFRFFNAEDFWTPLTISLAVIIPVILLALLAWGCFALGKRQGAKQDPQVYEDIDNLPKPYLVPRVKSMYAESESSFVGRSNNNNNIYSV